MMERGFYVWNPKASAPTCQHTDFTSAVTEAERLAGRYPGETFIVLRALGKAVLQQPGKFVPSFDPDDDGIPF